MSACIADDTTVREHLRPLQPLLDLPGVRDLCVNRPFEAWLGRDDGWCRHEVPGLGFRQLQSLATAVATWTGQHTGERQPLLSATLPGGERVQVVQPGVTAPGVVALAIRKPASRTLRLAELGLHGSLAPGQSDPEQEARRLQLVRLHAAGRHEEFLRLAVRSHCTILVAGKTGCGKTTFMKALVEEVPAAERLLTIEDAAELTLPSHPNKLQLFYSKGGQGTSAVGARELLEASLRLRPDRIFLAELRGAEAYSFLRLAASGHPGSMSSLHAGSCALAFEQLALMVRESAAGGGMTMDEIGQLARNVVDVVVHLALRNGRRTITELHFDPRGVHA